MILPFPFHLTGGYLILGGPGGANVSATQALVSDESDQRAPSKGPLRFLSIKNEIPLKRMEKEEMNERKEEGEGERGRKRVLTPFDLQICQKRILSQVEDVERLT